MAIAQSRDPHIPWRNTTLSAYSTTHTRKDGGTVRTVYVKDSHTGTLLQFKAHQASTLRDELTAVLAEMEQAAAQRAQNTSLVRAAER